MIEEELDIRVLIQSDEQALIKLFKDLEPAARFQRFGHTIADSALHAYALETLASSPIILGAFVRRKLAGVAEVTQIAPDNTVILAFVVRRRPPSSWRWPATTFCGVGMNAYPKDDDRSTAMFAYQLGSSPDSSNLNARISLTSNQFLARVDTVPVSE